MIDRTCSSAATARPSFNKREVFAGVDAHREQIRGHLVVEVTGEIASFRSADRPITRYLVIDARS